MLVTLRIVSRNAFQNFALSQLAELYSKKAGAKNRKK